MERCIEQQRGLQIEWLCIIDARNISVVREKVAGTI